MRQVVWVRAYDGWKSNRQRCISVAGKYKKQSWNRCLNEYKKQLVVQLLEIITLKIMKKLISKREKAEKWESNLTPKVDTGVSEHQDQNSSASNFYVLPLIC